MRFYEKHFANNYEELITYYPRFYRDVFEMVEVLKANGRILDGLEGDIEQAYLDCFIDHAGEEAISKLEKFLHIGLDKSRSIEERRRLVKSYFSGLGKVSASSIGAMIKAYTGAEAKSRFEAYDEAGNQALFIDISRGENEAFRISDILGFLKMKIPAHVFAKVGVNYRQQTKIRNLAFLSSGSFLKVKPGMKSSIRAAGQNDIRAATFLSIAIKVKPTLPVSVSAGAGGGVHAYLREENSMKIKPVLPGGIAAKAENAVQADLRVLNSLKVKTYAERK